MSYDHAFLSRVLAGKQLPSPELAASLDGLLGADGEIIRMAGELLEQSEISEAAGQSLSDGERIASRDITHALESPLVGVSPFSGMSMRASSEHLLKMFLHLDDEMGGDSLYAPLARYVARMSASVRDDPKDGLPEFGQLNQLAGWLALDSNNHVAARRHFMEAVAVGRETNDLGLTASALAYMSLQDTYRGELTSALSLAQEALSLDSSQLTPLTRTMLGTRLARAHASLGESTECFRTLESARNSFADSGSVDEPHYVSYVDSIEVAGQEGACFLALGMSTKAVTSLASAIGLLGIHSPTRVRDRVHYLARLAKCYLISNDLDKACQTAMHALDLSQMIGSSRVAERLSEFERSLAPYRNEASVVHFKDRYRTATLSVQG
jgi:tetratricopeptide (TPR) repeat protein